MGFSISKNDSLEEAFIQFKSSYQKDDFLTQTEVPLIIQILENPRYSLKLFGIDLFPGRVTLERHDYLHALMNISGDPQGEAIVIGATMGSTGNMNCFKAWLFVWLENILTSKQFHQDSALARKVFYRAVQESTLLAKKGILKDLSTFNIEDHLSESVISIQKILGLDVLMFKLQQAQLHDLLCLGQNEKKYINDKTEELYEKRITPYALNLSPVQRNSIIDFQKNIFIMDHYFENNDQLDSMILKSLWRLLEENLNYLGLSGDLQKNILQDIRDYADIEGGLREGKLLSGYDIEYFYLKKSCDVRMQRHIIRYLNHQPPVSLPNELMNDIVEEIEDDIDDIDEDRSVIYNGNRFLEVLDSGDMLKLKEYETLVNSFRDLPYDTIQRIIVKLNRFY